MRKLNVVICLLVLASLHSYAQQPVAPVPQAQPVVEGPLTLDQRFLLMKTKGQSYNDYKVIKEVVLDGVWKITKDSIKKSKTDLIEAKTKITQLANDVQLAKDNLKQKELSVADITFDSTHVTALGIPFTKSVFLVLTTIIIGGLIVLLVVLLGALRFTQSNLKERAVTVDVLTKEFEEYKKKALDKETKILRQLQDERNKYHASAR